MIQYYQIHLDYIHYISGHDGAWHSTKLNNPLRIEYFRKMFEYACLLSGIVLTYENMFLGIYFSIMMAIIECHITLNSGSGMIRCPLYSLWLAIILSAKFHASTNSTLGLCSYIALTG